MKAIGKAAHNAGKMFWALQNTVLKTVWLESLEKWCHSGNSCACWDIAARHKLVPARVPQCAVQEGCELVWGERSSTRKCWHFQEITQDMSYLGVNARVGGIVTSIARTSDGQAEVKKLPPFWQWGLSQPCWNWKYFCMICMYLWCLNSDHILLSLSTRKTPRRIAKQKQSGHIIHYNDKGRKVEYSILQVSSQIIS